MAHVQKVTLQSGKIRWRARWRDGSGAPQSKNFTTQGEAKAYIRAAESGEGAGSSAMTVAELAKSHYANFDALVKRGVREAITRDGYSSVFETHVKGTHLAKVRLCDLRTPAVQHFLDGLIATGASAHTARKARRTIFTWCKFAKRRGWLTSNPAESCEVIDTKRRDEIDDKLEVPPKAHLAALLDAAESPRDNAVVRLLMFGGLRISELLGLADDAVVLIGTGGKIKVRERLETRYFKLGPVKSVSGLRDVPIGPTGALAVKTWRLARGPAAQFLHTNATGETKRVGGRLFPNPRGTALWTYPDFIRDCWHPLMERAGLLDRPRDLKRIRRPLPSFSPHALRHVAVSLWIEQGIQPKRIQELAGHTSLSMTMDLYGHLWSDAEGDVALAAASEALIRAAPPRSPRGA